MRFNWLYYQAKPFLPRSLFIALRRWRTNRLRKQYKDVWPINEQAGATPKNWPGWPDGKKFALVLTHDVEGPSGLAKCRQLMQLEMDLGFRSSFNFIPEGDYGVTREFREELLHNGFEVGVHDLHHDGKLYRNYHDFAAKAKKINSYIKEWGVNGFRSGAMHHNLDWIQELDIKYDASTFDTDPFEPQPDGTGTIFPFWVPGANGKGYVELPYTLPQDFTLFVLLKEKGPQTWIKKLEWIAKMGGMALLDVHPDYVNFEEKEHSDSEYPALWYKSFLQHIQTNYRDTCWYARPKDIADWYRQSLKAQPPSIPQSISASRLRPKRICMVSYSAYQKDARVMRYATALAERGDHVDVAAIKTDPGAADVLTVGQVRVHRLLRRSKKNELGKSAYLFPLLRFWVVSSIWLSWKQLRARYDLIHIHNIPDFLVFAAWLPKLMGAKIILDIHDIVPEFYASKFNEEMDHFTIRMLKKVEKASATFADHVIISNDLWLEKYTKRSAPPEKCSVFINNVDRSVFYPRERTRTSKNPIIIFPGGLQWHQGLDIAIKAFALISKKLPEAEFHIYGDGNVKNDLIALTRQLGMEEKIRFFDPLPATKVADFMANADLGVVPKRADSFGNEAYSTKIMEFMSLGVPVAISRTKIDTFYFTDDVVRFFESGNVNELAETLYELLKNPEQRDKLRQNGFEYAARHGWDTKRMDYLNLVDSLTGTKN